MNPLARTTAVLEEGMRAGLHIGAQVYVSHGGSPVADFALGESKPGVAMTPDTIMLWLSSSKPIASVAMAQLWERGKLRLDDPVAMHVPEFAQHGKETIAIRHLLTHTAGIRWVETGWPATPWEQIIARICAMRPERDWPPGRKAGYSAHVTWFMLGEIVRRLDGRDYDRYVREEIFQPLGMTDSWVAMPPGVYHGYGDRLGVMQKTEGGKRSDLGADTEAACTRQRPSGSGHGPMRQLARFYEMLLNAGAAPQASVPLGQGTEVPPAGDSPPQTTGSHPTEHRILSPQSIEALVARHRAGMFDHTFRHVMDWGLGFLINSTQYDPSMPYGYGPHASPRTFGHSGSQSSVAFADPETALAVAIVCNGTPGEAPHQRRMRAVLAAVYDDVGLAPAEIP